MKIKQFLVGGAIALAVFAGVFFWGQSNGKKQCEESVAKVAAEKAFLSGRIAELEKRVKADSARFVKSDSTFLTLAAKPTTYNQYGKQSNKRK